MSNHQFISYSSVDAEDFAIQPVFLVHIIEKLYN